MSDITQAADRLRRYYQSRKQHGSFPPYASQRDDEATLAEAYLADHPSDDGELITEEWLSTFATTQGGAHAMWSVGDFTILLHGYRDGYFLHRSIPYVRVDGITTRGQLRRLIEVLR